MSTELFIVISILISLLVITFGFAIVVPFRIKKSSKKENKEIVQPSKYIKHGTPPKGAQFRIGECVIAKDNHYSEPFQIGFVVGYYVQEYLDRDPSLIPLVLFDGLDSKNPYLCMSPLVPYSDMMATHLASMNYKKQYDYICDLITGSAFPETKEEAEK